MASNLMNENFYKLKKIVIDKMIQWDIIKFGNFILKSGESSPIYLDMRLLVSHPSIFKYLAKLIKMKFNNLFDSSNEVKVKENVSNQENNKIGKDGVIRLMGVPLGGIPLASYLSHELNIPLVMLRDKIKNHGLRGKILEGEWNPGDTIIMIDDVITTGGSIIEARKWISDNGIEGIDLNRVLVICDRSGVGKSVPFEYNSIFRIEDFLENRYFNCWSNMRHLFENVNQPERSNMEWEYNLPFKHPIANKLYYLALQKKSNLIISLDICELKQIFDWVEEMKPYIIGIKLHIDLVNLHDFGDFMEAYFEIRQNLELMKSWKKDDLVVIEDAKYADIADIVMKKIEGKTLGVSQWADAVTCHGIAGHIYQGIHNTKSLPGLIMVTEMSSSGNLISCDYTDKCLQIIREGNKIDSKREGKNDGKDDGKDEKRDGEQTDSYVGVVCQSETIKKLDLNGWEFPTLSPGINLSSKTDGKNQSYTNPLHIGNDKKGMFWIVGRGITSIPDAELRKKELLKYQNLGWKYFLDY